jgi:hypothetical protein
MFYGLKTAVAVLAEIHAPQPTTGSAPEAFRQIWKIHVEAFKGHADFLKVAHDTGCQDGS